jgi:hypothetical protein
MNRRKGVWTRPVLAGLVAFVVGGLVAGRPAAAQVLTASARSADDLFTQLRALARAADPESGRAMLDGLDQLSKPGALDGLDRTRPLGAFVELPDQLNQSPSIVVFAPVTDLNAFLASLSKAGSQVDEKADAPGFSHKVLLPGGQSPTLYLVSASGYAFLSTTPAGADRLKAIRPDDLKPAHPGALVAGLRLDRMPAAYRQVFLAAMDQRAQADRERRPGEKDAEYKARMAGMDLVLNGVRTLINEGREVALGVDVTDDPGTFELALEVDARDGTNMADALRSFGERHSRFAGVFGGAAARLAGVLPLPEPLRNVIREGMAQARASTGKDVEPGDREALGHLLDAIEPTVTGDEIDGIIAIEGIEPDDAGGKEGTIVVLFGVGVKDAAKIEAAFREGIARSKPEEKAKVALDAEKVNGVPVHRVELDEEDVKDAQFGAPRMFLAFPEGAAYAAVGEGGLSVLKKALTPGAGKEKPAAEAPQVGLEASARQLARLSDRADRAATEAAAKEVFAGADAGKDHVSLRLTSERGRARLRLVADLPVLRYFALIGSRKEQEKPAP